MNYQKSDPIILGSGELYLGNIANPESATEAQIEAALVNVGAIAAGASIEYKPKTVDIKSANRGKIMSFISDEDVTFKCGVISWVLENMLRLCPSLYVEDPVTGSKSLKIGGQNDLPVSYLRFIHKKADGGDLIVNITRCQSGSGFSFTFDSEKALEIDYEFTALADTNGNLVEIKETFPVRLKSAVTDTAGTKIICTFNKNLATIPTSPAGFIVTVGGIGKAITAVTLGTDKRNVEIIVTGAIKANEVSLSVSYVPGTIKATDKDEALEAFTEVIINKSTAI